MYSVGVRDHVMIAHSFRGEVFGPAQRLHGATYVVDVEFSRSELDADGIVVDIGLATTRLHELLEPWRFRNLDELPEFDGQNTTTELLAGRLWAALAEAAQAGRLGESGRGIQRIRVVFHESHAAWAAFERDLTG